MKRLLLITILVVLFPTIPSAHLCNDVFIQAKDNLVVKVDIRDGQLRIGKEASFKVYLLNTMDREIVNIALEVKTDKFDAEVKQSSEWTTYPVLKTVARGGKKEYFEVTLTRKKGVADGKYAIELRLFNGQRSTMEFKSLDLDSGADICELDKAKDIKTDGKVSSTEWKKSFLCTDFYSYVKKGRYYENQRVDDQPRFRIAVDDTYVYGLMTFVGYDKADSDVGTVYIAASLDDTPKSLTFSRTTGKLVDPSEVEGLEYTFDKSKENVEFKIPRKYLGIESKDLKLFCGNFTRTITTTEEERGQKREVKEVHYWRGNSLSENNPVVYAKFKFPE